MIHYLVSFELANNRNCEVLSFEPSYSSAELSRQCDGNK